VKELGPRRPAGFRLLRESGADLRLQLRPDAWHLAKPARLGRFAQLVQRADAERFSYLDGSLRAQAEHSADPDEIG
jgi:hypothetical protein